MTYQVFNPAGSKISTASYKSIGKLSDPGMEITMNEFDRWWNKTFAQHLDMVAEASAIMSAHPRATPAEDVRLRHAH